MKKLITFAALMIVGGTAFTACKLESDHSSNSRVEHQSLPMPGGNANQGSAMSNAYTGANTDPIARPFPENFWSMAARGDLAEVELGKLAAEKAQNPEVKQFAQMMISDHSGTSAEVKQMAQQKGVTLPTELDAAHAAIRGQLSGVSGAEFDRAYMEAMVRDHEATVRLFSHEAESGTDADAKAFAAKTLPKLKQHLEAAKAIQAKLGGGM